MATRIGRDPETFSEDFDSYLLPKPQILFTNRIPEMADDWNCSYRRIGDNGEDKFYYQSPGRRVYTYVLLNY